MASIRHRGDKWQARIKRNQLMIERSFRLKADAHRWALATEADLERGTYKMAPYSCDQTLSDALLRYGREVTPKKRGAEVEGIRITALARHAIAAKKLSAIRPPDVAAYRDERIRAGRSASTIAKELGLMSAVYKIAKAEWGYETLVNPVAGVAKPRQPDGRKRRLLDDEEELLLSALDADAPSFTHSLIGPRNPIVKAIVVIAIETAMRRSEILSLKWEHIDFVRRVAHLPMTKNGSSRDIPLSSRALETLKGLAKSSETFVFPLSPNALKLAFSRAIKRAKQQYRLRAEQANARLFVDLTFHDLRHEATSRLAEIFQAHELAKITGHKDLRMLLRYYHPKVEDLARKLK
jgi:integrase